MVLSKSGIEYCCEHMNLLDNYCPENIQTCSYDLRMGGQYYYYRKGDDGVNVFSLGVGEVLKIPPNAICYVITEETVNMPADLTASISLSFGLIKQGVMLAAQPPYDPGYKGKTVALLHNLSNESVKIERGQHILNIIFTKLSIPVTKDQLYKGSYQQLTDLKKYCKEVRVGAVFELKEDFEKERKRFINALPNLLSIISVSVAILSAVIGVLTIFTAAGPGDDTTAAIRTSYPEFSVDEEANTLTICIDGKVYEIDINDTAVPSKEASTN